MADERPQPEREKPRRWADRVARKEQRKLRARREERRHIWFGFGMFGLVGWSVAIPTLIGVAVGIWIDKTYPGRYSWTLMCLIMGVIAGCLNAWYWMKRESGRD